MHLSERQTEILHRARALGRVEVEALAAEFAVTTQTIRRDLNDLSQSGLLARVHGGAVSNARVANVAYAERRVVSAPEKRRIGERCARMIPDGCSVMLNIGTTTEEVARALTGHRDLVVITNNLNVVQILSGTPSKDIILAGGIVRQSDGAIVGDEAVQFISKFKADFAVIGCSALDEDGAIMDYDLREVAVSRAIVENARRTILVCDRLKFERTAPIRICSAADVHAVVTDAAPPPAFAEVCARAGVAIEIAGEDAGEASGGGA